MDESPGQEPPPPTELSPPPALPQRSWLRDGIPMGKSSLIAGLLMVLFVVIAGRDITRPFYGLHGYGQAQSAWAAKAHVTYGLGYTHGLGTLAVGNPPPPNPPHYLDHPQLPALLGAVSMVLFGTNEWALRLMALLAYAASVPFLLALLRRLFDERVAVLAVLLFVVAPLNGYFYSVWDDFWILPLSIAAWWNYLAAVGELRDVARRPRHNWALAASLFLLIQISWFGAFYAATIGIHYAVECLRRRIHFDRRLFTILVLTPALSFSLNLVVLLGAGGWDYQRLIGLFRFRAAADPSLTIGGWLAKQWEFTTANFTLPVLAVIATYVVWAAARRIVARRDTTDQTEAVTRFAGFPHAWLFFGPGLFTMIVFRAGFWVHQFYYLPFAIGVAIAAAVGVVQIRDSLSNRSRGLGDLAAAGILVAILGFSVRGLNNFYASRHYPENALAMFKRLQREIPPDGALLSFDSYVYPESPYKVAFYRPEIAWSLDRQIVSAVTVEDVVRLSAQNRYQFYLADSPPAPPEMIEELKRRYPHEFIKGQTANPWPPGNASFPDKYLFDLRGAMNGTAIPPLPPQQSHAAYDAIYLNGNTLLAQQRYGEAVTAYGNAIALIPNDPKAAGGYNNLGWALQKLGRLDDAAKAYERAIQLDSTLELARNNLAAIRAIRK